MKKFLFCFAMIFVIASAFPQNWCPPGARWHFKRGYTPMDNSGTDGVIEMSYTTNTTVIGIPCKRLDATFTGARMFGAGSGWNITEHYKTYYTYSDNNVIFLYNETNAFDTVVNFNALPGDKWMKPRSAQTGCASRPVVIVTDTSHITINGYYLKHIRTIDSATIIGPTGPFTYAEINNYVERILFFSYFTPNYLPQKLFATGCEQSFEPEGPPFNVFRCYEDANFSLFKSTIYPWDLHACNTPVGFEKIESNNLNLSLYPNPNKGGFELEIREPTDITICNMVGNSVYTACFQESGKITIETVNIAPGVYILKAKTSHGNGQVKFIAR